LRGPVLHERLVDPRDVCRGSLPLAEFPLNQRDAENSSPGPNWPGFPEEKRRRKRGFSGNCTKEPRSRMYRHTANSRKAERIREEEK